MSVAEVRVNWTRFEARGQGAREPWHVVFPTPGRPPSGLWPRPEADRESSSPPLARMTRPAALELPDRSKGTESSSASFRPAAAVGEAVQRAQAQTRSPRGCNHRTVREELAQDGEGTRCSVVERRNEDGRVRHVEVRVSRAGAGLKTRATAWAGPDRPSDTTTPRGSRSLRGRMLACPCRAPSFLRPAPAGATRLQWRRGRPHSEFTTERPVASDPGRLVPDRPWGIHAVDLVWAGTLHCLTNRPGPEGGGA